MREVLDKLMDSISIDELSRHINYLCNKIGIRIPGTNSEWDAAYYIVDQLKAAGLSAQVEPFEYLGWIFDEVEVYITYPIKKKLTSTWFVYSMPTPPNGVEGEVVYCGGCSFEELCNLDLNGKIALAGRRVTTSPGRHRMICNVAERGAIAYLEFNTTIPEELAKVGTASDKYVSDDYSHFIRLYPPIPAASISYRDAKEIMDLMEKGPVKVRVKIGSSKPVMFWRKSPNVIAEIPGSKYPEEKIIIVAHHDADTIGAHDNASGVAAAIELAEFFLDNRPLRSIILLFPGAEQFGLHGSEAYVKAHRNELDSIVAVIDFGAIGFGEAFWLDRTPDLGDVFDEAVKLMNFNSKYPLIIQPPAIASDHAPFIWLAGIPGVELHWREFKYLFTPLDTPENINIKAVRDVAILGGLATYKLANSIILPLNYERYANEVLEAVIKIESKFKVNLSSLRNSLNELKNVGAKVNELIKTGDENLNRILMNAGRPLNRVMMGDFTYLPDIKDLASKINQTSNAINSISKVEEANLELMFLRRKLKELELKLEGLISNKKSAIEDALKILSKAL